MNTYTCISDESCSFDICPDKHELGTERRGSSLPNISINSWDSIRLHNILLPLPQGTWASKCLKSDCVKLQQRRTPPKMCVCAFTSRDRRMAVQTELREGSCPSFHKRLEEVPSEVPVSTQAHRLITTRSLLLNLWLENIQSKSLPRRSWKMTTDPRILFPPLTVECL